jgi:hypothetical protein
VNNLSTADYLSIKEYLESDFGMTNNRYDRDQWDDFYGTSNSEESETTQPTENSSKTCPRCQKNERLLGTTGRVKSYCTECIKEYSQERYLARRAFVNEYKLEVGCQSCGYKEHPVALEFDHIDPSTKKFSIGSQLMSMSWKSIHEEIAKCQVLCANCHQIHTHESNHYAVRRSY